MHTKQQTALIHTERQHARLQDLTLAEEEEEENPSQ